MQVHSILGESNNLLIGEFRRITARLGNIWGRISEQKSEKSSISGFQAFDDPGGEFSLSQKLLLDWRNESGRTEADG